MTFLFGVVLATAVAQGPKLQPRSAVAAEPPHAAAEGGGEADDLPVSLARIQRALARPSTLAFSHDKPVFRVEVFGRKPTIEDILGPDYLRGPVPYGGMTHQEFLSMVTPKDVQGYAAFTNAEGLTVAATSIALQWALLKAIHKYETAREERAKEAARREVQDALAELTKARKAAGLPPK